MAIDGHMGWFFGGNCGCGRKLVNKCGVKAPLWFEYIGWGFVKKSEIG